MQGIRRSFLPLAVIKKNILRIFAHSLKPKELAALIRVGIPNDKIKWNSSTMGGFSGDPFTVPATKTGRHPGNTFTFPEDPANTHGVIFR
jgi:hypothetical protein